MIVLYIGLNVVNILYKIDISWFLLEFIIYCVLYSIKLILVLIKIVFNFLVFCVYCFFFLCKLWLRFIFGLWIKLNIFCVFLKWSNFLKNIVFIYILEKVLIILFVKCLLFGFNCVVNFFMWVFLLDVLFIFFFWIIVNILKGMLVNRW